MSSEPLYDSDRVLEDIAAGERGVGAANAGRLYPADPASPATVFRHISRGCRGVRLGAARGARGIFTTPSAIRRFHQQLSGAEPAPASAPAARRAHARACRELDALGVK